MRSGHAHGSSSGINWCPIFLASNIFKLDIDRWSKNPSDPANYWLAENGKTGEDQGFILDLGCALPVWGVNLRNTHNADHNDRSTKKFLVRGSLRMEGPWKKLLTANLHDSRHQDPPPLQALMFEKSVVVTFVKFELLEYWGAGGGLQYFTMIPSPNQQGLFLQCQKTLTLSDKEVVMHLKFGN